MQQREPQTRKEKIELLNNLHSGKVKLEQLSFRTGYTQWTKIDNEFYNHTTKNKVSLQDFKQAKHQAESKNLLVFVNVDGQKGFDEEHSSPDVIEISRQFEKEF